MRWLALCFTLPFTSIAHAEVPRVATDIAPVHSLVASVMGDLGTPDLILPPGGDPHHFQLRPSQMRSLSGADLVVWVGPALTPWLGDVLQSGQGEGRQELQLFDPDHLPMVIEGMKATLRATALDHGFADHEGHGHDEEETHAEETHDAQGHEEDGHEEGGHDEGGHDEDHADAHSDEHGDHDLSHEAGHEAGHETGHEAGDAHHDEEKHAHDHGPIDPHIWLDPINAVYFLDQIAQALSGLDPQNAARYAANASAAKARLLAMTEEVAEALRPLQAAHLVTYHDAYKYFFFRFELPLSGSLSDSDATAPSAGRLNALRAGLAGMERPCLFTEPGANEGLIATVLSPDQDAVISHLDALGSRLTPGPELYETLIRDMSNQILACQS